LESWYASTTSTDQAVLPTKEQASTPSASRAILLYTLLVVMPIGLIVALLVSNWAAGGTAGDTGHGLLPGLTPLARILAALAVIIGAARLAGYLAQRLGQPAVIGEIAGGILLGPSVLQAFWPAIGQTLLAPKVTSTLDIVAQLGVVLFVFMAGLEVRPQALAGRTSMLVMISHAGMVIPLLCGVTLGVVGYPNFAPQGVQVVPFALFVGLSLSVTALPVLARILEDRRWNGTRLASLVLASAAMNDVLAWCLLAVVLALAGASSGGAVIATVAMTVVMIGTLAGLGVWLRRSRKPWANSLGLVPVLVAVLLTAVATEFSGVHAVFGAFMLGVIIPAESVTARRFQSAAGLLQPMLLPVFFAASGLRTDITQLGGDLGMWTCCMVVVVVAIASKVASTSFAARSMGMPAREAIRVGGLMNCRGLTEIIVLNVGLNAGLIDTKVFTMLVIMALVSTVLTSAFLRDKPHTEFLPVTP
jgi:Kef-type K+ transport system membrane component KefB